MDIKTLLIFVCGLSILIALHELGHFIAAKIFNVYVYEYSLFMGPKIFQFKIGETKYTLRCLPIGGYCSMAGEEDIQANRNLFSWDISCGFYSRDNGVQCFGCFFYVFLV